MKKSIIGVSAAGTPAASGFWNRIPFFGYQGMGRQANPCIGASYVAPVTLPAGSPAASSEVQAQCGFEEVTLLFQGQLQVRDSAGHDSLLEAGDVLWNSAGRGLLRQDSQGPRLAAEGGTLEMASLWVNLPAAVKLSDPHRQHLAATAIPVCALPDGAGQLRVIAGEYEGTQGAAETVAPLQLWDIRLQASDSETRLQLPSCWYGVLLVLEGTVQVNYWPQPVTRQQRVFMGAVGQEVSLQATQDAHLVLISGEPLEEPIAGQGALVMLEPGQVQDCLQQLEAGKFGVL